MKKQAVVVIIVITLFLLSLPYVAGLFIGNSEKIFTGLILNPIDGYSYYAKMAQGYKGNWLFQLPFTADPGKPVFLFFFYILLGHISKCFNISIQVIYHIARLGGAVFLAWQLWKLINENMKLVYISKTWCFLFLMFASGLGWLGLLMGYESGDLVIPEAYPFYSSLINPHFPWGIGLFIFVVNQIVDTEKKGWTALVIGSIAFAIIMPFGSVILCVVISVYWLFQKKAEKAAILVKILLVCVPAALIVGFQYYETITHDKLMIWNQQNITPTPPIWDILLSFSPMILFALYSLRRWKGVAKNHFHQIMVIWFIICLIMIFIPLGFQRRFMFAFAIPVGILGLYGLDDLLSSAKSPERWKRLLFIVPSISILFLLLISFFAIINGSSYSFVTATEADLYQWISSNSREQVILAERRLLLKFRLLPKTGYIMVIHTKQLKPM